jgi:hypothetical protein
MFPSLLQATQMVGKRCSCHRILIRRSSTLIALLQIVASANAVAMDPPISPSSDRTQSKDPQIVCRKDPGLLAGPAVPTKEVARQIYVTIASALYPNSWRKYRTIFVLDEGTKWGVGQRPDSTGVTMRKNEQGEVIESVTTVEGGGSLEMDIDKCNASVSMSFSR